MTHHRHTRRRHAGHRRHGLAASTAHDRRAARGAAARPHAAADRDGHDPGRAVPADLPLRVRRRDPRRRRSRYVDFLVPGFVVTGVLFSGHRARPPAWPRTSSTGFVDRLRSLPIPRSAVLAARALADTALLALGPRRHGRDRLRGRLPAPRHRRSQGLAAFGLVRRVRLRVRVGVHLHRACSPATPRRRRACRCSSSRSRSSRAPTSRSRRCRAGCSRSPSTSR